MARDIFPLGFHAGVGGLYPADLIRTINKAGHRAFVKVVDDEGRAEEALRIGDAHGVQNVVVFRVTKHGKAGGKVEVEAPQEHENPTAAEWWQRHMKFVSPSLDRRIWLEVANETDRNTYAWQGRLFHEIARDHALPGDWRICAPGSNSGEPESWDGWEDYLKLCARQPDRVAVSLHFYAWGIGQDDKPNENWDTYFPDHVGRESRLYALCDRLQIPYPTIHITEGGFAHNGVPDWKPVVDDYMRRLANYVAAQPNMTGVGLWCCQPGFENVHNQFVNKHVPQLARMAEAWQPPGEVSRDERKAPPADDDSGRERTEDPQPPGTGRPGTDEAGGALKGLVARRFGLGHDGNFNFLRVGKELWFHFEIHNASNRDVPYGGIGAMAWAWDGGAWQLYRWQHSYGGFGDRLAPGETLSWGDHVMVDREGIFALSLAVTSDEGAHQKREQPATIRDVQYLREPVYVKIGPHFANGEVLARPPAPLFATGDPSDTDEAEPPDQPGGTDTGGQPAGATWRPSRRQVTYLLAPTALTGEERSALYQMAWNGVPRPDGGRSDGKHTVTFSHDDAFDNVVNGAPGSFVAIVEPQRIGSGISATWMAEHAANVPFVLLALDGTALDSGVGGNTFGVGDGDTEDGAATGTTSENAADGKPVTAWVFADFIDRAAGKGIVNVDLLNVRSGPDKDEFPTPLGQIVRGAVVALLDEVRNGYASVRVQRADLRPVAVVTAGGTSRPGATGRYVGPTVKFRDGIHGPGDAATWREPGFRAMLEGLGLPVKFMSDGDRFKSFTAFNRPELELVRVFWTPNPQQVKNPQKAWQEDIHDGVLNFYKAGARHFEVLNEPRLGKEGMGHQWHSGEEFGKFLRELMLIIKKNCPEAKLWYPGESPGMPWTDQFLFSRPAYAAVADLCHGICQHAYTGVTNNAQVAAGEIVDQVREFRNGLSSSHASAWDKPLIISESSVNRAATPEYRAKVYAGVARELKQIPGTQGIFWYISHWNAPENEKANAESWFGTDIDAHYRRMRS